MNNRQQKMADARRARCKHRRKTAEQRQRAFYKDLNKRMVSRALMMAALKSQIQRI